MGEAPGEGPGVAVGGGGHSIPGWSVCEGGLMIDLSPMKTVHVDVPRRVATAEPVTDAPTITTSSCTAEEAAAHMPPRIAAADARNTHETRVRPEVLGHTVASSLWQSSMSDQRQFPPEVAVLTFGEHARHLFSPSRVPAPS